MLKNAFSNKKLIKINIKINTAFQGSTTILQICASSYRISFDRTIAFRRCIYPIFPAFWSWGGALFHYRTVFRFRGTLWLCVRMSLQPNPQTSRWSFSFYNQLFLKIKGRISYRWGSVLARDWGDDRISFIIWPMSVCWCVLGLRFCPFYSRWFDIRSSSICALTRASSRLRSRWNHSMIGCEFKMNARTTL